MSQIATEAVVQTPYRKFGFVDQARGIAVLMVILVHVAQRVPHLSPVFDMIGKYAQMGVQLFFVASAYTLCNSFDIRRNESAPALYFYIRRFFRIAPLYYFGIVLYFLFHPVREAMGLFSGPSPFTLQNISANLLFIHGFVPSANNSIVPGGWSIGTEMAFYLLFPPLFLHLRRAAAPLGRLRLILVAAVVLNLLLQLAVMRFTAFGMRNNNFLYFNLLNQLPVFLIGIGYFFWLHDRGGVKVAPGSKGWSFLLFALCTALSVLVWKSNVALAFAVIPLLSGLSFVCLVNWLRLLNCHIGLLNELGRVSYSMYICHFVLAWLVIPHFVTATERWLPPEGALVAGFLVAIGGTYLMARLTEHLIEARGIRGGALAIAWLEARSRTLSARLDEERT